MNIRIHIHEILRLRIYPWILSMKKSRIHIRNIHGYIHGYIHIRVSMESPTQGSHLGHMWTCQEDRDRFNDSNPCLCGCTNLHSRIITSIVRSAVVHMVSLEIR